MPFAFPGESPFASPGGPPFAFPPVPPEPATNAGGTAWPAQTAGWPAGGTQPPQAAGAAGLPAPSSQLSDQAEVAAVPYDLADMLRRMHGIDVSDVAVDRGPDAGRQAHAIGTRAFTRDGQVAMPLDEGPFERPQTRALLAHELTHVAQQRALGSSLPTEDSAFGLSLEAQAAAVERRVLGHDAGAAMVPLQELRHFVPQLPGAAWPSAAVPTTAPVQRQVEQPAALPPAQGPAPASPAEAGAAAEQPAATPADESEADGESEPEASKKRLLDLDDATAVRDLADGIYERVHARLRHELLVGRERSGLLSDFR